MVKGRKNLQRKKGEELFSLCPLEWLVKAIVTCEQSLSAISSLDFGGGGGGGREFGRCGSNGKSEDSQVEKCDAHW